MGPEIWTVEGGKQMRITGKDDRGREVDERGRSKRGKVCLYIFHHSIVCYCVLQFQVQNVMMHGGAA